MIGKGPEGERLPYTFIFKRRVGVYPMRDPAFLEPVFVINTDITKIGIIILMAQQISAQLWRN
jgi:hypothetical protein